MAELSPILAELEKLYPQLVSEYVDKLTYDGQLTEAPETPIITLASKGKKRTQVGWYNPAVWTDQQEDVLAGLAGVPQAERAQVRRAEIVLATELLENPVQTASEMLRQVVVHYEAARYGNLDGTVGAYGYYPQWWEGRAKAFNHQATVLKDQPSRGWADWQPLDKAAWTKWVQEHMNTRVFEVARVPDQTQQRPGSRMKKWSCGCTTVRCAIKLDAVCQKCGNVFQWAEPREVNPWKADDQDQPSFNLLTELDHLHKLVEWYGSIKKEGQ